MQIEKKTFRKILAGALGCILLYWALNERNSVSFVLAFIWKLIGPFIAGASLAFILNIPVRAMERSILKKIPHGGLRRAMAVLLTFLCVLLVILLVLLLVIPQLKSTIFSIISELPLFIERIQNWVTDFLAERPQIEQWIRQQFGDATLDWGGITAKISSWLSGFTVTLMNGLVAFAGSLVDGVVSTFIAFVFAIYALFRKEILSRQARMLLYSQLTEKKADRVLYIGRLSNRMFGNFLSGQCLEACILGCLFAAAMLIFRMPYVALISVLIAVTALIPVVGTFIGCFVGAFLILVDDPIKAIWFVLMFLILQQLENNLIYPRVVGSSIGLPSMWVLVAVSLGGNLMGVMGILVMIPAASVLYTLLRERTYRKLSEKSIPAEKLQPAADLNKGGGRIRSLQKKMTKPKTQTTGQKPSQTPPKTTK